MLKFPQSKQQQKQMKNAVYAKTQVRLYYTTFIRVI